MLLKTLTCITIIIAPTRVVFAVVREWKTVTTESEKIRNRVGEVDANPMQVDVNSNQAR